MNTITIKPYNKCEKEDYIEVPVKDFETWSDNKADDDQNNYHEVLVGDRFRPYFDFEVDFNAEDDMRKNHYACLKEAEMEIARVFRQGKVIMLDSTGYSAGKEKWRISARFFVKNAGYYRNPKHLEPIVKKFTVKGFDDGVYYRGKTMRMINCHKEGDERHLQRAELKGKKVILIPLGKEWEMVSERWSDWMVGDYLKEEKKCLDPADDSSESEDEDDTGYNRKPMSLEKIKGYVQALSEERATSRNSRRVVIMALRQLADYQNIDLREIALDFAMGAGDNYDEAKVEDLYENPGKHKFTFNIVIGWARKDTPDIEEKLKPKAQEDVPPKPTFYNDYRDLIVRNDVTLDEVKDYMRGCIAKVSNNGNSVYFTRGEEGWTLLEAFPFKDESESYTLTIPNPAYDKKKKASKATIVLKYTDIYKELQRCPIVLLHCNFDKVNFIPYPGDVPPAKLKRIFNTFTGHRFKIRADFKPTGKCDLLLKHLFEVLADGNEEHYNYILDWTAHLVQVPDDKLGVCLIFISKPRAGKNTYWDFIRNKLLPQYSMELSDMEPLLQKHNDYLMNKLLITLNEVANGAGFRDHNRLKAIITDPVKKIEPKGAKSFMIDDFSRYVMMTNNEHTVKKEDAERYIPFRCSNKRCGDIAYFKRLRESMTDECAEEFFQILMHRDLSKSELREPPQTDCGDAMSRNAASTAVKFMVDVADCGALYDEEEKSDEIRIWRDPLYDAYVFWAKRTNSHVMGLDPFLDELKQIGLPLDPVRMNGRQNRGLRISRDELRKILRAIPAYRNYEFQE